jgi:hypothetical protein
MRGIRGAATVLAPGKPDDYFSRLLKYIPAEVVAFYISAGGIVPADHPKRLGYLWAIFTVGAIATPVYMLFAARDDETKKPIPIQILLATIAFPVWAYAMGGPFASLAWYEAWTGSLLLLTVTFVFGAVKR